MAKKQAGKINRVIYIDSALDAKLKKASDVNWSAVASAAFERELSRRKTGVKMSSMIERLRASKAEHTSELRSAGKEFGEKYAQEKAEYPELKRLSELLEAERSVEAFVENQDAASIARVLDPDLDLVDVGEFWTWATSRFVDQFDEKDFLCGFVEGVNEVFQEVRGQL